MSMMCFNATFIRQDSMLIGNANFNASFVRVCASASEFALLPMRSEANSQMPKKCELVLSLSLTYFFYALIAITSVFKFLLKHIARTIDVFNVESYTAGSIQTIRAKYKVLNFISLEILIELLFDIVYYDQYYFFFMQDLSFTFDSIDNSFYTTFIKIALIHISSNNSIFQIVL